MPVIQRIEIANFLNSRRQQPWHPDWPHAVMELRGENTAINIPNGRGKSTLVTVILAMLLHETRQLTGIRASHFAPKSAGSWTHVRIQVLITTPGTDAQDLVSIAGGDLGGHPLVVGVYGHSGDSETLDYYAYQGILEECPVAVREGVRVNLVGNDAFREVLRRRKGYFPSTRKEATKDAWDRYIQDFFDVSSLRQQLAYQKTGGPEGQHAYFRVTPRPGERYSSAVFYERCAPELLQDLMGDLGEEDETGIEDTIHETVSRLLVSRRNADKKSDELKRTERTIDVLQGVHHRGQELSDARSRCDAVRLECVRDIAILRHILVERPIPGVLTTPPAQLQLAAGIVLQDGRCYIPDQTLCGVTGEAARTLNERGQRKKVLPAKANRSYAIENTCDLHEPACVRREGHAPSLYTREQAIDMLRLAPKLAGAWTQSSAAQAVNDAFDWAEGHADTNPARLRRAPLEAELREADAKLQALRKRLDVLAEMRLRLRNDHEQALGWQREYRRMAESGLFCADELAHPARTGEGVEAQERQAQQDLLEHDDRCGRLSEPYRDWKSFVAQYGEDETPSERIVSLRAALDARRSEELSARQERDAASRAADALGKQATAAHGALNAARERLNRFQQSAPFAARFIEMFGSDENPVGLEQRVRKSLQDAERELARCERDRAELRGPLEGLAAFRAEVGEHVEPAAWYREELNRYETLGRRIETLEASLEDTRIRRAALDTDPVAPGTSAREAAKIAGGEGVPLYQVLMELNLPVDRRQALLTLFSALLHARCYPSAEDARRAAQRLAEAGVELPVFASEPLAKFCLDTDASAEELLARHWLVGIETRQVLCLLDPALVAREREELDECIDELEALVKAAREDHAASIPTRPMMQRAQQAATALTERMPERNAALDRESAATDARLPGLRQRASDDAVEVIRGALSHRKHFPGVSEADLQQAAKAAAGEISRLNAAESEAAQRRDLAQERVETAVGAMAVAKAEAERIPGLERIQSFLDTEGALEFMRTVEAKRAKLRDRLDRARNRKGFSFDVAQALIDRGLDRPKSLEQEIQVVDAEQKHIEGQQIPEVSDRTLALKSEDGALAHKADVIDRLINALITAHRDFRVEAEQWETGSVVLDQEDPLMQVSTGLRSTESEGECIQMLTEFADEFDAERFREGRARLRDARKASEAAEGKFALAVDGMLTHEGLELGAYVRGELTAAKDQPERLHRVLDVMQDNFAKNRQANEIASRFLAERWSELDEWLQNFTQRLPEHLRLLKRVFAPRRDPGTSTYNTAGFEIEARLASLEDVRAILNEIVDLVERRDEEQLAIRDETPARRDRMKRDIREEIRQTFYRKVIQDPKIRVYMPSISDRALLMTKDMVSTGQGVAMTLLWLIKMADFATQRDQGRLTSGRARTAAAQPTQFAIMDGAFSSLSDTGLIRDALDSIAATRGRFQLIITGHDNAYKNDFRYFPSLVFGRELGGRYLIAESDTHRLLSPEDAGRSTGSLELAQVYHKEDSN